MSSSGSGMVSSGTARTINAGRDTIGVLLHSAKKRLQHVFIAFVIGMLGGIIVMRLYVWPQFRADLLVTEASIIARNPFAVILMQVKIGLGVGIALALPVLLYHAKQPLRERGLLPELPFSRTQYAVIGIIAVGLAVLGTAYAYLFFFPLLFSFLAENALSSGLVPRYSIVHWTQFIIALCVAFAAAAELPLAMTSLTYAGIVKAQTWKDYWRHAVIAIVVIGTMINGSPEPFSAMLVAVPMIVLYIIGIYTSRVAARVSSEFEASEQTVSLSSALRKRWNILAGVGIVGAGVAYAVSRFTDVDMRLASQTGVSLTTIQGALIAVGFIGVLVLGVICVALFGRSRQVPVESGEPGDVDIASLSADGVRAAPPEAFASMSENEALASAQQAMEEDDTEKAQAVLDRYDEVQAQLEQDEESEAENAEGSSSQEPEEQNAIQSTAAGMMNAFTEDETPEDDIGGYFYDIRFILGSLRSRSFYIIGTFVVLMGALFTWLYSGGFGRLEEDFIQRIPPTIRPETLASQWPIVLHPIEALVFMVKISVVIAAICTLPLIIYYLWPSLSERGFVTGSRRTIAVWGGGLVGVLLLGSYIGYAFVAPEVITFLVVDALRADMAISYTVSNFAWLVFMLTVGIGLLADIPMTMILFHFGGIVSYGTMYRRWRVPVLSILVFAAFITPDSLYTMLVVAIPMVMMYGLGLGLLYVVSFGGRWGYDLISTPTGD